MFTAFRNLLELLVPTTKYKQEAQLSQKDCMMVCVTEYSLSHSRSLKVIVNGTIWQIACEFLLAFHSNYRPILHHFRDKVGYWSKIAIFSPMPLLEYCHKVWYGKTRMVWLHDSEKMLMICLAVLTHRVWWTDTQTDRQTDRQTDMLRQYSPRYALHTHRAVEIFLQ